MEFNSKGMFRAVCKYVTLFELLKYMKKNATFYKHKCNTDFSKATLSLYEAVVNSRTKYRAILFCFVLMSCEVCAASDGTMRALSSVHHFGPWTLTPLQSSRNQNENQNESEDENEDENENENCADPYPDADLGCNFRHYPDIIA